MLFFCSCRILYGMKNPILVKLGKRFKALRIHYEWTQAYVSERADITDTYYSDIERGLRNVSFENINALAKAYKLSLSELFDYHYYPSLPKQAKRRNTKTRKKKKS